MVNNIILMLLKAVDFVVVEVEVAVVPVVNVVVGALLVLTDHIIFSCGQ